MLTMSLGGRKYVMICVIVRFLRNRDAPAASRNLIAKYITPAGLKIVSIRTDERGEFEGEYQQVPDAHDITVGESLLMRHHTAWWRSEPSDCYEVGLSQCYRRLR